MKIDIHTHTRQCKSGDAPTREISAEDFCATIRATDVGIVAITNHNVFDADQYNEISEGLGTDTQVWPGVELDIIEQTQRGHMLVIVAPTHAAQFANAVETLTTGFTPDNFTAQIAQVLDAFDKLNPLYVAHYKQKKPNLTDEAIQTLAERTAQPHCVLKEVTNSISAGIYISHGYPSIYGSDVQNWEKYVELSEELPDLRLPVDSFEHFCLLLKKDPTTINTALSRKTSDELELEPFGDGATVNLQVFNDINVVFGPKGTGKSCILKAIARHYAEQGMDARVFESASDKLDEIFDLKGKELTVNLNNHNINYCADEIKALREASEAHVTSLTKYLAYFSSKTTNRNARKLKLKDIEPDQEGSPKREFEEFDHAEARTAEFVAFLAEDERVAAELDEADTQELSRILDKLLQQLRERKWAGFVRWKEVTLLNSAIKLFRDEVSRKTGTPAKPTTTGFRKYAFNRIAIEANAMAVVKSLSASILKDRKAIGSLGAEKGELSLVTEFVFQTGDITDSTLKSVTSVKKGTQKSFAKCVTKIRDSAYKDDLFEAIAQLNDIEDVEEVIAVYELLLFRKYFALQGRPYEPSSGEASMLMLQKELQVDRDIYILDEPERSLGNEYISSVIVPMIKERASAGKKVVISTHDANIAVRTLPYASIYRCHGAAGYSTYLGNAFTNDLVNADNGDRLDWKAVSMKTLEGGQVAFGERGKIYGNS